MYEWRKIPKGKLWTQTIVDWNIKGKFRRTLRSDYNLASYCSVNEVIGNIED